MDEPQLISLRRQGYLSAVGRPGGPKVYWRLRFRHQGRLMAVYIGSNRADVTAVQQELVTLRAPRRQQRQLDATVQQGRRALRAIKRQLGAAVAPAGFYFHGDRMRKKRTTND